jgi:hypothetical protein
MINPLAIATRGRIAATSARTLALATLGWIIISATPPIPPSGGGGGGYTQYENTPDRKVLEERKTRIKRNEQEWLLFIKIYTEQCL